jgi:hypothetical protein
MKSRKPAMLGIAVILVIALLLVPVAAKTASGNVKVENHDQNSVDDNSVTVEKNLHVELSGDASYKDEKHDPIDETSNDGTIHVILDADIAAQGKTTGTGSAILDGDVKAEGSHNADNTSAVINTSVTSSVVLNSGTKGSAQGCVNTNGTASATYQETVLESDVSGSTHADGKVSSGSVGLLNATGGILSEASFLPDYVVDTVIYSNLYGENNAAGSASASGSANASAGCDSVTASVTGATKADGSGKGSGEFDSSSEISAEAQEGTTWGYVETSIYANSSVQSGSGKYTAKASSSASTTNGENEAYYGNGGVDVHELEAYTTGIARSSAEICDGKGEAGSEAEITAFASAPGLEMFEPGFGPEFLYIGIYPSDTYSAQYIDGSILKNDAWATGYDKKSKVSAGSSTNGTADATLNYLISNVGVYISNTTAEGKTSAKVNIQGWGESYADSQIASFDLIHTGPLYLGINEGPVFSDLVDLPEIPEIEGYENPLVTQNLDQDLLAQLDDQLTLQQFPIIEAGFELPPIDVLEISIISQSVSAHSADKSKAFADACADGETAADGSSFLTEPQLLSQGSSSAEGFVAGKAEAGGKCEDGDDPASASVILGLSAQGIGLSNVIYTQPEVDGDHAPAGLDATLIASVSGAGGSSGKTWGTASGDSNASGGFNLGVLGPSSSSGTVNTAANANGGLGLSAAAIGSADYTTFNGLEGSLVDVALIGTGSFAAGTAGAHADANGWTEANGSILHQISIDPEPVEIFDLLNITSSASASGTACSDVSTKNGIALAADVILAGESTGANQGPSPADIGITSDGNDLGGGIAGSTISQLAFAQQFGKAGSAKANTYANGQAGTCSSFYADLGAGSPAAPVYISGDSVTGALGEVKGSANAGCGDPLSVSTIMAFTDYGGEGFVSGNSFFGGGEVYDAALIASLSSSGGMTSEAWGSADGSAVADSHLEVNTTPEDDSLFTWDAVSTADAKVKTTASTAKINGLGLGLAAQGSSSQVETGISGPNVNAEEHAITLDGALSVASGDGKATADVNKMEVYKKDKKGKVIEVLCIPIVDREATAFAQFTGDFTDDGVPDVNVTSSSVSGSSASTSAEAAKGGFALSLAGEASGALTEIETIYNDQAVDDVVPDADQDVFSVIADLAIAETDCSKETAKALASADGDTSAFSYGQIPNWNGTQSSSAVGSVSANAIGGDKCKDPLAASIILALGENEAYPDPSAPQYAAQNTSDTTLIASLSVMNGTKGDAGATATGSANANGMQLVPEYTTSTRTPLSPTASASTEASVWSHASGNNGMALGVAGVGSTSFAYAGYDNENVSDQNLMFSYATGQGFGKKAVVEACAGYDAADTAASASNVYDRDLEVAKAESNSSVAGVGSSFVKASDYSKAQALSFGWAGQNASIDWLAPSEDGSHADATVLFGTEANATDNAKGTLAKAEMCQVNLEANARAGFVEQYNIPEEYASAKVIDGNSHVFLDPYYLNGFVDWDTVFTPDTSVSAGGSKTDGIAEAGDLGVDPNYWYTHGGAWANSDVSPAPSPWPPHDMILSHIPA